MRESRVYSLGPPSTVIANNTTMFYVEYNINYSSVLGIHFDAFIFIGGWNNSIIYLLYSNYNPLHCCTLKKIKSCFGGYLYTARIF
jgi:hypothetical protein